MLHSSAVASALWSLVLAFSSKRAYSAALCLYIQQLMLVLFYGFLILFLLQFIIGFITSIMITFYLHSYDLGYSLWRRGPSYKVFHKVMEEQREDPEAYKNFQRVKPWVRLTHYFRFIMPVFLIVLLIYAIKTLNQF